jgi:hypothetical protein
MREAFLPPPFSTVNPVQFFRDGTLNGMSPSELMVNRSTMKLTQRIKEAGAAGYILLWLLGIPIPILLVIFLLRGCS